MRYTRREKGILIGGFMAAIFVAASLYGCQRAFAEDRYAPPDLHQYYASLMQPDDPSISCCGPSDAYYADEVVPCNPLRKAETKNCALVAIITDTRPDKIILPDGSTIGRVHIPPGSRIPIPREKTGVRRPPNPTGHNIVFIGGALYGPANYHVYCWEPLPRI